MRNRVFYPVLLVIVAGLLVKLAASRADGWNAHQAYPRSANQANVASANPTESGSYNVELEYLKAVNSTAPPKDPQLLFLLMGAYANAHHEGEGVEFLSA